MTARRSSVGGKAEPRSARFGVTPTSCSPGPTASRPAAADHHRCGLTPEAALRHPSLAPAAVGPGRRPCPADLRGPCDRPPDGGRRQRDPAASSAACSGPAARGGAGGVLGGADRRGARPPARLSLDVVLVRTARRLPGRLREARAAGRGGLPPAGRDLAGPPRRGRPRGRLPLRQCRHDPGAAPAGALRRAPVPAVAGRRAVPPAEPGGLRAQGCLRARRARGGAADGAVLPAAGPRAGRHDGDLPGGRPARRDRLVLLSAGGRRAARPLAVGTAPPACSRRPRPRPPPRPAA